MDVLLLHPAALERRGAQRHGEGVVFIGEFTGVAWIRRHRTGQRDTRMMRAALRRRQEVQGEDE
jgi:hypothetical protein